MSVSMVKFWTTPSVECLDLVVLSFYQRKIVLNLVLDVFCVFSWGMEFIKKGYCCYDPITNKLYVSRYVTLLFHLKLLLLPRKIWFISIRFPKICLQKSIPLPAFTCYFLFAISNPSSSPSILSSSCNFSDPTFQLCGSCGSFIWLWEPWSIFPSVSYPLSSSTGKI